MIAFKQHPTRARMDVLNRRLADSSYVSGDNYTIADMAINMIAP